MSAPRPSPAWRVAITRNGEHESLAGDLESRGFVAVSVPVLVEGPPADPAPLIAAARNLERFDWLICSSVRAVRAIADSRDSRWPANLRTAAVGSVTAAALAGAGAINPIHAATFNAGALLDTLRPIDTWKGRRVLIATVAGGRRDVIDGLTAEGALVTEVEAYAMTPRADDAIRADWERGAPDAVILASPATARHLIGAIGLDAIQRLKAIVAIGPTTSAALNAAGIRADVPAQATFASSVDLLASIRHGSVTA